MKEKGFTLIELLAVIVILSVIALITTPMVIGVIESSKKGAKESSASGYVGALEQYQVTAEILGKKVIPDTTLSTDDLKQYDIDVKGETPIDGYVTIKNKQVVDYKLQFDEYLVSYNSEKNKGEAIKEKIKGDYTVYKEGEQVTIDGVSYHVIKNSLSYSDSVTLLRDESIGEMMFDDNGGTDFETSTLKTYLNSTYKDTFGDKKQYIKEITLIDFGKIVISVDSCGKKYYSDFENIEGTLGYLYKKYEWIGDKFLWTKDGSSVGISKTIGKDNIICDDAVHYSYHTAKYTPGSGFEYISSGPEYIIAMGGDAESSINVRPVIVIEKEAL